MTAIARPRPGPARPTVGRIVVFLLWCSAVGLMASQHAFWRDEVRALSLALQGGTVIEMLRGVQGEGHPALWYLMLRAAHAVVAAPMVLPAVGLAVATASAALLVFRSPFPLWLIALVLATGAFLFEYAVMARNYGVSILLLFLLAHCYPRHRDRGILLGALLFLLVNTNVPAVVLAGAFLVFWLVDVLGEQGLRWTPALRSCLLNGAIATLGVVACLATVYPPVHDAVVPDARAITFGNLSFILILPALNFMEMLLEAPLKALEIGPLPVYAASKPLSLLMFASLLTLIRSPGAMVAALLSLWTLSGFFRLVYPGGYRHEALWLGLVLTFYWILAARAGAATAGRRDTGGGVGLAGRAGLAALVALLLLQVPAGIGAVVDALTGATPLSRARDLGQLIAGRPDLAKAIVIPNPDYLAEALPYYVDNPIYLMREQRFGRFARFRRSARDHLDLDDLLSTGRGLAAERHTAVLFALRHPVQRGQPDATYAEGYAWELRVSADQAARFLDATELLAHLAPAKTSEEFYVYRLPAP